MTSIAMDNINYQDEVKKKTSKPLLWIGLVSIVMFFAGLTSAVVVSQGGGNFISVQLPSAFAISTVVILLSSVAYHIALTAIKKENYGLAKVGVVITLLLGLLFVVTQFIGWQGLHANGIIPVGKESTQEGSYLYLLTFLHVLHLLGGLVSLSIVLVKTIKKRYTSNNSLGMQVSITYWHFLGGLWVFLYLFLNYIIA